MCERQRGSENIFLYVYTHKDGETRKENEHILSQFFFFSENLPTGIPECIRYRKLNSDSNCYKFNIRQRFRYSNE